MKTWEFVDANVILEDGTNCSLIHCCDHPELHEFHLRYHEAVKAAAAQFCNN